MVNVKVNLGGLEMPTFLATASGTFGYGFEYVGAVDYSKLGAVTAKGIRGATEPESVHNTCIDEMARHVVDGWNLKDAWVPLTAADVAAIFRASL